MPNLLIQVNNKEVFYTYLNKEDIINGDVPIELDKDVSSVVSTLQSHFQDQNIKHKGVKTLFLISPADTYSSFISTSKEVNSDAFDEYILSKVRDEINVDEYYFSYFKCAPFIVQFIGIKKDLMDFYLGVANGLGVNLKGIISWAHLLPHLVNSYDPSAFLVEFANQKTLVLSDFGSVYSSSQVKDFDEITFEKEGLYKHRNASGNTYTVGVNNPPKDSTEMFVLNTELKHQANFEVFYIVYEALAQDPKHLYSSANVLNYLPLPVSKVPKNAVVYVSALSVLAFVGYFAYSILLASPNNSLPSSNTDSPQVLSEQDTITEDVSQDTIQDKEDTQDDVADLNKETLLIRVENGAGTPGLAGQTRDYLLGLDWNILSVGDANAYDYTDTFVYIKESKEDYYSLLESDLEKQFSVVRGEDPLDEDEEYDVLIILGDE